MIDGYRRALDKYNSLGRQRDGRSEIKLSDQRGTIVCSQGIKICPYNELFTNNSLPELYSVLSDSNSQKHFTFFIDGPFSLVTNRNSLTDKSIEIINSNDFLTAIKQFLDECKDRDEVFKELIKRLNNEYFDIERTKQAKYLSELKDNFSKRDRFRINNKLFVAPQNGEEHWVGALYTLLGHIVEENNPFKKFWIRPLNFSARGIDSIGSVANEVNSISEPLAAKNLKAIEYKFQFNSNDIYNHPLDITDYIVAWTIDSSKTDKITDEFNLFGTVSEIPNISKSLSFKIRDIQSQDGDTYHNEIIVVCLKELIENTFNTKITPV
ncbi:MAG: hypothetical protein IPG24_13415 [Leptospiraceae bacterium]|nr:hypothetical protein [Leptospiraceae bacterium]